MPTTAHDRSIVVSPYLHRSARTQEDRGRKGQLYLRISLTVLAAIFLSHSIAAEPTKEVRRILILNELGISYPAIRIIDEGIQTALQNSPYLLEFYSESMDTILFPDPATQQEFRDFYIHKYRNRRLDVIITVGSGPLNFMREAHQTAFPGVPIIFCLPSRAVPSSPTLDSDFTGVKNDIASAETLDIALRLRPDTKHVVVVGGVSDYDKQLLAAIRQQIQDFADRVDITFMTDLAMGDLDRLRHLPNHTIVLLTTIAQDATGASYKSNESGPMIAGASNAPVFSLFDVFLNHGEVGGDLSSFSAQAKVVADMALRIFNGEKPQDIPRAGNVTNYMFDWRALKRWGMNESALPPGSIVLNRPLSVWESYKWYIIGGISLIVVETLLIFGLVWERARAREAETKLGITDDRLRMAVEAGNSVGWDWDIKSGRDQWFGDLPTMFGIPSDSHSGDVADFRRRVYPEDRELVSKAIADARQNRKPYIAEFRVVRNDGAVRWITARGKFYYSPNGEAQRMLGMAVDITDRKHAEHKLQESQNQLAGIVESAMDAIIALDEEQQIVLFNAAAERLFGSTQGDAIGTSIDRFIPQRFSAEHRAHIIHFGESSVTTRAMGKLGNLLAIRTNGQEFPIEASISYVESDGKKLFTVIIRDITERRKAEAAIRESEERFRLVANTAPVMIWMSGPDKLRTYFNQPWLDFTGRPLEAQLGNGWAEGVHAEDLSACMDTYTLAFDRREPFKMQYRLRRNDGEYRWLFDIGIPRFNLDGSLAGYIGSCIDVTERKMAEDALASLSSHLIEEQEEERKRIAREIHDDYNQRLAMIAIDLEQLAENVGGSPAEAGQQIHDLVNRVGELGTDLHSLSHRLHSSTLEALGLVAGVKGFCEEYAEQHGIQVDFAHENVPPGIPKDVAICMFRIVQEGLRNVRRHSGANRAEVRLEWSGDKLHLSVSDRGTGFDPNQPPAEGGIGIMSMQERLRVLGGRLEIHSQPMEGTRIDAWVPFEIASRLAS